MALTFGVSAVYPFTCCPRHLTPRCASKLLGLICCRSGSSVSSGSMPLAAITQEIYDAHKKENTKKSIDLNAEYVKAIQSRNSAIDDEIKQSQTKLANGYEILVS